MNFQSPNPMQNRFQMQAPMSTPTPFSMAANPASQAPFAPQSGMPTATAQAMQGFGRGNDSMLVHMSPREVGGLQALARANGGQLTRNPQTGLPEAGFLENILPTLAGLVLAPIMGPVAAGLTVGGATGLATGDINKGLMAGLGAFGGAGIGEALTSTGTAALEASGALAPTAGQAAMATMAPGAEALATMGGAFPTGMAATGASAAPAALGSNLATLGGAAPMAGTTIGGNLATLGGAAPITTAAPSLTGAGSNLATLGGAAPVSVGVAPSATQAMNAGLSDLTAKGGLDRFMGEFPGGKLGMMAGGAGLMSAFQPEYEEPKKDTESKYEGPYQAAPREVSYPSMDRILSDSSEYNFFTPTNPYPGYVKAPTFADGGDVNKVETTTPTATINIAPADYKHGVQAEFDYGFRPYSQPSPASGGDMSGFGGSGGDDGFGGGDAFGGWASGGLASLNAFAQGGRFLQGAGDGVSDSIKATIGGSQPARLADGEFVVDARTVSELGNGSSKAGAKKLYAMMDRVQNARKKAGRGKDSNADKYLPA